MVQIFLVFFILWVSGRSSADTTESDILKVTESASTLPEYLDWKNENRRNCTFIGSIKVGNGSRQEEPYYDFLDENRTYETFSNFTDLDTTINYILWYIFEIGITVSLISVFLHLVVFCMVRDLRNLPGWNLAALCVCLFSHYLFVMLIINGYIPFESDTCEALASVDHFAMLSTILWSSVMSFDVFMSLLQASRSFKNSSTQFSMRKFGFYCLCGFGIPLLFCLLAVLVDKLDVVPEDYRPGFRHYCKFEREEAANIFFIGPFYFLVCLNFILFGAAACIIHVNKRNCDQDAQQSSMKRRYLVYLRLLVFMGVTKIIYVMQKFVHEEWLIIISALLDTFQGLFIFFAFTCSKKVKKYFRQKLLGDRASSEQTFTPPFHSHLLIRIP